LYAGFHKTRLKIIFSNNFRNKNMQIFTSLSFRISPILPANGIQKFRTRTA